MVSPPPTATLSRRALLKTGLAGGAVVALSGFGLTLQKTVSSGPVGHLSVLSPDEYAVLAALAERLCPGAPPDVPPASVVDLARSVDYMLKDAPTEDVQGFKIALRIFESPLVGALVGERVVPFTRLSHAAQERTIEQWRDSRVEFRRTVYAGLSGVVLAVYWGDPRAWSRIGYAGPPDVAGLRSAYADNLVDLASLAGPRKAEGT